MKFFLVCLALVIPGFCRAEVPKLLTERDFTAASVSEAANHFINIGESATFKELDAFLAQDSADHANKLFSRGYDINERIAWVFRILYEPREGVPMILPKTGVHVPGVIVPLRAPKFGSLCLPESSMTAKEWPLYPLILSGSTYIVLREGYARTGMPETIEHYMNYCKDNGVFRKTTVEVPTQQQALKDVQLFRQSAAWKSIKWMDNGGVGFPRGEEWTWIFIQNQASNIPETAVASNSIRR